MKRMRLFSSLFVIALLGFISLPYIPKVSQNTQQAESRSKFQYELPSTWLSPKLSALNAMSPAAQNETYRKHIELLKNKQALLPLGRLDQKMACIALGGNSSVFTETLKLYADRMAVFNADTLQISAMVDKYYGLTKHEVCIFSLHAQKPNQNEIPEWAVQKSKIIEIKLSFYDF